MERSARSKEEASSGPPGVTEAELVEALTDVGRLLRRQLRSWAEARGAAGWGPAMRLLPYLVRTPGITVNELARRAGIPRSRASVLVTDMEREGLLRKEADPADRRLVHLHLTPRGLEQRTEWQRAYTAFLRDRVRAMPPDRMRDLTAGLRAFRRALADREDGEPV